MTIRIAAITRLCQRKIVWPSGMTPVTGSSEGGIADRVAWSRAADEDRPRAHTLARPREAAAELGDEPGGALAQGQAGDEHEDHAREREDERVGEVALAEVREERAQAGQGALGSGTGRHGAMLPEAHLRRPGRRSGTPTV